MMWVEYLSLRLFFVLMILKRFHLVEIGLIFDDSQLSFVTFHYKILSVCSMGCKNLLNFIWKPANFHNRHHTTLDYTILHSRGKLNPYPLMCTKEFMLYEKWLPFTSFSTTFFNDWYGYCWPENVFFFGCLIFWDHFY